MDKDATGQLSINPDRKEDQKALDKYKKEFQIAQASARAELELVDALGLQQNRRLATGVQLGLAAMHYYAASSAGRIVPPCIVVEQGMAICHLPWGIVLCSANGMLVSYNARARLRGTYDLVFGSMEEAQAVVFARRGQP